jgi:hypothetical protein
LSEIDRIQPDEDFSLLNPRGITFEAGSNPTTLLHDSKRKRTVKHREVSMVISFVIKEVKGSLDCCVFMDSMSMWYVGSLKS